MLDEKLNEYARSGAYPFHMPGHKRQELPFANPYRLDITEIDGFDNLHHADGILKASMERAAALYGAERGFFLVNGSTCGILAAICAATRKGSRILVARNCHKSVFHAMFLQELSPVYLYPKATEYGILGAVTPEMVENALKAQPDLAAVVITSPTYDGIVSDICRIAQLTHSFGLPLIVDEAHGAHFGFSEEFPENAIRLGADAVILSLHKTLPAFTQTALLLLGSDRIAAERIEKYLGIFESSSPSYLLMAGIEKCLRYVEEQKETAFRAFSRRLASFREAVSGLSVLRVLDGTDFVPQSAFAFDPSKLLLDTGTKEYSGRQLQTELRERFRLELEMAQGSYALAMTSICDTDEGFFRLAEALCEIDRRLYAEGKRRQSPQMTSEPWAALYLENERVMELFEADCRPKKAAAQKEAAGAISAEYVCLYPPGIPIITPGERITEHHLKQLARCIRTGLCVEGLPADDRINIVI